MVFIRTRTSLLAVSLIAAASASTSETVGSNGMVRSDSSGDRTYYFVPKRRLPDGLASFFRNVAPGGDEFPEEKDAFEIAGRLHELSASLRGDGPPRAEAALDTLLAPDFKGGRLTPADVPPATGGATLEIVRGGRLPAELVHDRAAFGSEMSGLLRDFDRVQVAEILITAIERGSTPDAPVRTVVRYDIVGHGQEAWRAQRVGQWEMRWQRGTDGGWRVSQWIALDHLRSRARKPIFTESTGLAFEGVESMRAQLGPGHDAWLASLDAAFKPDTMALHGLSAADVNGDGLDDLYVAQPAGLPNRLYRARADGTFVDATSGSGLDVLDGTSQSLFGDVDNDGDQDALLVVRAGLLLFFNDGEGRFTRDALAFRFKNPLRGSPTAAAMADYDRDGFLDVYLGTYSYFIGASEDKAGPATPYHDAKNGPPNVLFRNDGRGRFVDVTDDVGLDENNDRFTLAAAWGDYDADGWPDLMVANDFGRKNLYHNLGAASGPLRFKDVAAAAGIEDYGAGMSAAWLDYDHDGRLDIYTGNMWTAAGLRTTAQKAFLPEAPEEIRALYRRHARGNSLFRNRGDGTFEDVSLASRTTMGRWAWSSDVVDFDLDGWEDLYVMNGMFTRETPAGEPAPDLDSFFWRQVTARSPLTFRSGTSFDDGWRAINRMLIAEGSEAPHERAVFLRNDGQGGFDDVSGTVGLDLDQDDRSFAVLDYDRDGDPDLVVYAPRASPQLRLFRNDRPGGNTSLAVRLVGAKSNRDAIGAKVTVETGEARLVKLLTLGSGFLSQHSKELLFGLGKSRRVAKLTVEWPSGQTQTFTDVPADQRVSITEGRDAVQSDAFATAGASVAAPAPAPAPLAPPATTWLYDPYPAPDFTGMDLDGRKVALSSLRGKPALLLFWATWAPPSREALAELSRGSAELTQGGIAIVALALDGAGGESAVRAATTGVNVPVVLGDEATAGAYAITNRFVFARREALRVPTAFLLNDKGEIVKAYRDRLTAADVVADAAHIVAPPADRLTRALPFKGAFYGVPEPRNEFPYALDLAEQGLERTALSAFERAAARDPNAITLYNLATLYIKYRRPAEGRAALERALALKPEYAEANNSLGALLAQSGDVPGGIARFRAALQMRPDFADALNNLGFALFQSGQEKEALALFQKAVALQPAFPEAYNNLGIFYGQQGDLPRAASYFKQSLAHRASYGEAATNLALVQMAQQDASGAIRTLQLLLEQDPGFEMAYVTLAKVYFSLGRPREAGQVLEQLLQRNPSHPIGLQMMRQLRGAR